MERRIIAACLLLLISVQGSSAISATGTITGRIVSTSINVQDISFNQLVANPSVYYYRTSTGIASVSPSGQAVDIIPFATFDFASDSGSILISIGNNRSLPNGAKIILDDDVTPDNTASDSNQIQLTGNSRNEAVISYAGKNGDSRIDYTQDGSLYVFINTGTASSGSINLDLTISS
jgi:hypothetical protein